MVVRQAGWGWGWGWRGGAAWRRACGVQSVVRLRRRCGLRREGEERARVESTMEEASRESSARLSSDVSGPWDSFEAEPERMPKKVCRARGSVRAGRGAS